MNDSLRQLQSHCQTLFACQQCCVQHYFVDIFRKEEVDNDDEVTYHAASIQLMQAYIWKGISTQHVLYLLGGRPAFFAVLSMYASRHRRN